jgi:hypothetical protein
MRRNSFILRIYQPQTNTILASISDIAICDITLVSKPSNFDGVCMHLSNQKKHGYSIELSKPFNKISGSNSSPSLTFKGEYIDIYVKNFPRYPAYYQKQIAARDCMNGFGYTNHINKGFMYQGDYRKIEIIPK